MNIKCKFTCFLLKIIFYIFKKIISYTKNYGISIILLALIIKILTYPVSIISNLSLNNINNIKYKINKINENIKYNKHQKNQIIYNIYQKNKFSIFTGIISIILQIPIFWSVFNVIKNSKILKTKNFILWIKDPTIHDPYYILPFLMGFSILISSSKLNYSKTSLTIYIIITSLSLWLPSGVILYYITNNILNIIEKKITIFLYNKYYYEKF